MEALKYTDSQLIINGVNRFFKPFKIYIYFAPEIEKYVTYFQWEDDDTIRGYREIKSEKALKNHIEYLLGGNKKNRRDLGNN